MVKTRRWEWAQNGMELIKLTVRTHINFAKHRTVYVHVHRNDSCVVLVLESMELFNEV